MGSLYVLDGVWGVWMQAEGPGRAGWLEYTMALATGWRPCIVRSGRGGGVCELGFEVGEAAVLEPHVRPGCLQPFVQSPVVGGELAYPLLEGGVLGGDARDGMLWPF